MERSLLHHFLNLHHHDAAVVVDGFGDDKGVEVHHFVFEGGVASLSQVVARMKATLGATVL